MRSNTFPHRFCRLCGIILLSLACSGEPATAGPFSITLAVSPTPPPVGTSPLLIQVADSAGGPLEGLSVSVEGETEDGAATRAARSARELGGGRYALDAFDFSMIGTWHVTVHVQDGQQTGYRRFRVGVVRGGPG
jgi:hypothetical protein